VNGSNGFGAGAAVFDAEMGPDGDGKTKSSAGRVGAKLSP
jgi:hypothetical protein